MAQTGYTPILIYSSSTVSQAPVAGNLTNSTLGSELAINITDGKLFYKDNANAVQVIAWKVTPTTAGGTGLTSYTAGDLLYYATGTTLSKLAIGASGYWLGSSGSAPQWNAPAALTKTDDTNVTLTLGGSASTALLNAASLTLGWTGTLAVSRGGTGTGTAFTAGSVLFAGASGVYSQDNANLFWDDTNNRLGLGTASPQYQLHASTSAGNIYNLTLSSGSIGVLGNFVGMRFGFTGNTYQKGAIVFEGQDGNGRGKMYLALNGVADSSNATASDSVLALSYTGDVTLNTGNIIQGTAAKGFNFTANTPAAGMTSQLLNWYEEGTFTPTIIGTTTTGTGTYSTQTGTYTRIGRMVRFNVAITWSAHTGTGNMEIAGLPFTSNASADNHPVSIVSSNLLVPSASTPVAMILASATTVRLYSTPTSGTDASVSLLALDTAATLWVAGTYIV